jgi:outer membrane protein TolC
MGKKTVFLVGCLVLALCGAANAAPQALSLNEAVHIALQNNDQLKAAREQLDVGREDVRLAQSAWQPRVVMQEQALHTNNPGYALSLKMDQTTFSANDLSGAPNTFNYPGYINDYQTVVSLEQPVIFPKAGLGVELAAKEYAAKQSDFRQRQETVAFQVIQSYLAVYTAERYLQVAQKGLADAKAHQEVAQQRYEAGVGLYSDLLRATTAVTEAEEKQVSAATKLDVAKRRLGLLLGSEKPVDISGKLPVIKVGGLEDYYRNALSRPDVRALALRSENARKKIDMAASDRRPVLMLNTSFQMDDPNHILGNAGQSWQIGAVMQWDVFDGERTEHAIKKAQQAAGAASDNLAGLRKKVAFQVYEAYLNVGEGHQNMEYAQSAVKAADEGNRLVEERYRNSLAPIVDLLDAQLNLDQARANLVKCQNDYFQAVVALAYRSGTLLKSIENPK